MPTEEDKRNAELARQWFLGDGKRKNYRKAFPHLLAAAQAGHIECQNALGYCYYCGFGVKQNKATAFYWYHQAAAVNHLGSVVRCGADV